MFYITRTPTRGTAMSFQPTFPALSDGPPPAERPATEKQIAFARSLAAKRGVRLPESITADRAALSRWIDRHKAPGGRFASYPSSRQVAFAERIARLKRGEIPPECFRDRALMSRWIDSNKPR
jgi:hypothetical protein